MARLALGKELLRARVPHWVTAWWHSQALRHGFKFGDGPALGEFWEAIARGDFEIVCKSQNNCATVIPERGNQSHAAAASAVGEQTMQALLDSYNAHPLLLEGLSLTEQEDALAGIAYSLSLAPVQKEALSLTAVKSGQPLGLVTEWCPQARPPLLASLSPNPEHWVEHVARWEAEISMSAEALASKYVACLESTREAVRRVYRKSA